MHRHNQLKFCQILSSLPFLRSMQSPFFSSPELYLLTLSDCSHANWMETMCQWLLDGLSGWWNRTTEECVRSCTQNADLDPAYFVFACMERTPKDLMQSSLTPNSDAGADTVFKDR